MNFADKVAIVTGGAKGIGKSYSISLLERGTKVCFADWDEKTGQETFKEFSKAYPGNVLFVKCDVSDMENFRDVFRKTLAAFGRLDIVVNNAGILDESDWRKTVDVNLIGVINGVKLAFEYMGTNNKGSGGCIVNTASQSGLHAFSLAPVYTATKHGVVGLTKAYGTEDHFRKTGVTVNAICPGPVYTPLFHLSKGFGEEWKQVHTNLIPCSPSLISNALIQVLTEGKNGALICVYGDTPVYV